MNGKLLVGHSFPRFHVITETESFLFSTLNLPPILHVAYVFPLQAIISCKLLCLGEDAQIPTTWPVTNALTPVLALSVSRLVDTLAESLDLHFGSLWIKARLDVVVGDTKQLFCRRMHCGWVMWCTPKLSSPFWQFCASQSIELRIGYYLKNALYNRNIYKVRAL